MILFLRLVVSYSISTSNHNIMVIYTATPLLYLIPFLHQTTTSPRFKAKWLGCILFHFYIKPQHTMSKSLFQFSCILFHFYIKPQLSVSVAFCSNGCILFHFYIKPQPTLVHRKELIVVSYSISTSNHNLSKCNLSRVRVVSYSISTSNHNCCIDFSCHSHVVSYSISTSNHNHFNRLFGENKLYLIPFLHQTTTWQKVS